MELIPAKNKKRQSRNMIFTMLLLLSIPFIYNRFTIAQIEDSNGADTAIVTFHIEDYKIGDKFVGKNDAIATDGSSSKKNAELKKDADYDKIYYTFEKFSGMKVLQETEVTEAVTITILSKIEEGNFEIAIFKDGVFLKVLKADENTKITFSEAGIYRIVVGGESAKGSVALQRVF